MMHDSNLEKIAKEVHVKLLYKLMSVQVLQKVKLSTLENEFMQAKSVPKNIDDKI